MHDAAEESSDDDKDGKSGRPRDGARDGDPYKRSQKAILT